jgi:hypothetical protein
MFYWRRKFWSGRFEGHVFVRIGNYRLNYRAENLKLRLTKYYGDKLQFIDMTKPGTYSWNLVFNAETDIKSMVRHVYKHWQIRWYSKVPTYWNQQGVRQWQPLRWLPTAQYLESKDITIPELWEFFNCSYLKKILLSPVPKGKSSCQLAWAGHM